MLRTEKDTCYLIVPQTSLWSSQSGAFIGYEFSQSKKKYEVATVQPSGLPNFRSSQFQYPAGTFCVVSTDNPFLTKEFASQVQKYNLITGDWFRYAQKMGCTVSFNYQVCTLAEPGTPKYEYTIFMKEAIIGPQMFLHATLQRPVLRLLSNSSTYPMSTLNTFNYLSEHTKQSQVQYEESKGVDGDALTKKLLSDIGKSTGEGKLRPKTFSAKDWNNFPPYCAVFESDNPTTTYVLPVISPLSEISGFLPIIIVSAAPTTFDEATYKLLETTLRYKTDLNTCLVDNWSGVSEETKIRAMCYFLGNAIDANLDKAVYVKTEGNVAIYSVGQRKIPFTVPVMNSALRYRAYGTSTPLAVRLLGESLDFPLVPQYNAVWLAIRESAWYREFLTKIGVSLT